MDHRYSGTRKKKRTQTIEPLNREIYRQTRNASQTQQTEMHNFFFQTTKEREGDKKNTIKKH